MDQRLSPDIPRLTHPRFIGLLAGFVHMAGCMIGICLIIYGHPPWGDPSPGDDGSTGLAAGFYLFFAILQALIHNGLGVMLRRRLAVVPAWRPLGASFAAGLLGMLACYATLTNLPHNAWVDNLSTSALTILVVFPSVILSWAALRWAWGTEGRTGS